MLENAPYERYTINTLKQNTMLVVENEIKNMSMVEAVNKYNAYFNANETALTKQQAQRLLKREYPVYSVNVKIAMGTGLEAWMGKEEHIIVVYINR